MAQARTDYAPEFELAVKIVLEQNAFTARTVPPGNRREKHFEYAEALHNRARRHSALGYAAQNEF